MRDLKLINGLVELEKLDSSFIIDMKYASSDNFMGKKIYSIHRCVLQLEVAKNLIKANICFKKFGYRLKILDAYRPLSVQKLMWESYPNEDFVAPLSRGSIHNRGCAVDVTLVDLNGNELKMPSAFDDFSKKAWITYNQCDDILIRNREFLAKIMLQNGFMRIETEWWHFYDLNYIKYPLLDISLELWDG